MLSVQGEKGGSADSVTQVDPFEGLFVLQCTATYCQLSIFLMRNLDIEFTLKKNCTVYFSYVFVPP